MKKNKISIILLAACINLASLWLSSAVCAEPGPGHVIPPNVVHAYQAQYGNAELRNWTVNADHYVARFKLRHKLRESFYKADGSWLKTETRYKYSGGLPAGVKQALHQTPYQSWYFDRIVRTETPQQVVYTIRADNSPLLDADHDYVFRKYVTLSFDAAGRLTKISPGN